MKKLSLVAVRKSEEIRLLSGGVGELLVWVPCGQGQGWGAGPQLVGQVTRFGGTIRAAG